MFQTSPALRQAGPPLLLQYLQTSLTILCIVKEAPVAKKESRAVDMFSEDMFADEYASPSSTAKMIANQVSTVLVRYEIEFVTFT